MSPSDTSAPQGLKDLVSYGQEALRLEAEALNEAGRKIGEHFAAAVNAILKSEGKVILTGLGKSGHIARKVASTLSSTGTSAFFLHPTEALHGDFGMLQSKDCLIAIAHGGETNEVLEVARFARRNGLPVIAITGKALSSLAQLAHYVIDGGVAREADPLNLAPTSSSTVAMALGDAIAVALMRARGFSESDFASLHPGGSLGRRLSHVEDHMHPVDKLVMVAPDTDFHKILEAVTARNFGIVGVVDNTGKLVGAVSDGDLRRALLKQGSKALEARAGDLMTKQPKTIAAKALALDALTLMNDKQITQLFVMSAKGDGKSTGIVRLHDLLTAKIL